MLHNSVRKHREEPWKATMVRPLTERSANAAKLDVALPLGVAEAFVKLVEVRNAVAESRRIFARDLHEEALTDLIRLTDDGVAPVFEATPYGSFRRKTFWVDERLKAGVTRIAHERAISLSAVVVTAFRRYLDQHSRMHQADAA